MSRIPPWPDKSTGEHHGTMDPAAALAAQRRSREKGIRVTREAEGGGGRAFEEGRWSRRVRRRRGPDLGRVKKALSAQAQVVRRIPILPCHGSKELTLGDGEHCCASPI